MRADVGRAAWLAVAVALFGGTGTGTAAAAPADDFAVHAAPVEEPPAMNGTVDPAGWRNAAHVSLGWDVAFQRRARDGTDVYFTYDARYLYVGFVARQSVPVQATQRTNGVGENADDVVVVRLWPQGSAGFGYRFAANPIGTRYQSSTENGLFAPEWTAAGRIVPGGYSVTMRIPRWVIRQGRSSDWRMQFVRSVSLTNELYEWAHAAGQTSSKDVNFAGTVAGISADFAERSRPRVAVFGLAQAASPAENQRGMRAGGDVSLPLTNTLAAFATIHPDFSNVEQDQQTIAPLEFNQFLADYRPFFAQGASLFNAFDCYSCLDHVSLYTPLIPAPKMGYALEGQQGRLSLAAFDALGAARTDQAQALQYQLLAGRLRVRAQRVGVDLLDRHDVTRTAQIAFSNLHNFSAYATAGGERGSRAAAGDASLNEVGAMAFSSKSSFSAVLRKVGAAYAPLDGFTEHSGIAGYALAAGHEYDFGPASPVQNVIVSQSLARYVGSSGGVNQSDVASKIALTARNQLSLALTGGSHYLRLRADDGAPYDQNGVALGYRDAMALPTDVAYAAGAFSNGHVQTWTRLTTFHLWQRATASLEADDTRFTARSGTTSTRWLERASIGLDLGPRSSLALGFRKVVGTAPGALQPVNATNLSLALHRLGRREEVFFAYGDPSLLRTKPVFTLKYVRYLSSEKGT